MEHLEEDLQEYEMFSMPFNKEFKEKENDDPKELLIKLQMEESSSMTQKALKVFDSNISTSPRYDGLCTLNELYNDTICMTFDCSTSCDF